MTKISRPLLRYPGGKFRIAKWICSHFPSYGFYCEPYCGAASVFFHKPKTKAEIINDIDEEVINVFRVLQDPKKSKRLEELLRLTPLSYAEYKLAKEPTKDPIEWARRIIYQSFSTIGTDGITRQLSGFRGIKNHESGIHAGQEWAAYPNIIQAFTNRLKGVIIECRPALQVIKIYDSPTTLFYLDPPYLMETRSRNRNLYTNEMSTKELHIELAKVLHKIKGMAILSGYDSPLYQELYSTWKTSKISARAQSNVKRVECIWMSPNIQTTLF